jgi:hypothetical protein
MIRKTFYMTFVVLVLTSFIVIPKSASGHDHGGMYIGVGGLTIPMVSADRRLTVPGGQSERLYFRPGFGGYLLMGYDFPDSRWGIQVPVEYHYFQLNRQEWVNTLGGNVEGVVRLVEWDNGWDFHLVTGLGFTWFFEGPIKNETQDGGINVEVGPGFSWFFARGDIPASLTFEVPIRFIYFFGDRLSRDGAFVFAFPVRIGFTIGF